MLKRFGQYLNRSAVRTFARKSLPIRLARPIVSFTFDDFAKSAWTKGGEIFGRYGVCGTYYFCARNCGIEFDGVQQYDREDLIEISTEGHEIGCHTAQHRALPLLDDDLIEADLAENAAFLGDLLPDETMTTFAYPYGAVSLRTKRLAGEKFVACRGVWPGINVGQVDLGLLRCVCLEPRVLADRSVSAWIKETVRLKGWLIFLTHDVSEYPTGYGVTPTLLESAIREAISVGCDVLPIQKALTIGGLDSR